jgi:hypothetical protein
MKDFDKNNIAKLYLENVNPNISEEDQKKLADFFVQLVVKIEQGDQEAQQLLNLPPDQLLQHIQNSQQVQQEAFENIRSRIGGAFKGTGPAQQRYGILLKNVQKKLWELGQDIQSTQDQNNIASYQDLISQVQAVEPTMVPTPGSLQQLGYNIGKGVGAVGKIAGTVAGAGLIASTLSTVGLPIAAVGAVVGGGISTLKNLSNTNMTPGEKIKKALISAGLGAVTAYALSELRDAMSDTSMDAARAEADRIDLNGETLRSSEELIDQGVEGVPETGVAQNASGGIDSTAKVRIAAPDLPNSERIAFTRGKIQALRQLTAHLGTDTIRGVTYDQVIGADGNMYVTAKWSQAMSDTAAKISRQMGN